MQPHTRDIANLTNLHPRTIEKVLKWYWETGRVWQLKAKACREAKLSRNHVDVRNLHFA
jgi:hypothetical protein